MTTAALALGLTLAACGDSATPSDDTVSTTPATAAPTTSPTTNPPATSTTAAAPSTTAAAPAGPPVATITIEGFDFGDPVSIGVGETVEVVNADRATHTWTAVDGPFNVTLAADATTTFTFTEPGTYAFFCSIHPSMTGEITVDG